MDKAKLAIGLPPTVPPRGNAELAAQPLAVAIAAAAGTALVGRRHPCALHGGKQGFIFGRVHGKDPVADVYGQPERTRRLQRQIGTTGGVPPHGLHRQAIGR